MKDMFKTKQVAENMWWYCWQWHMELFYILETPCINKMSLMCTFNPPPPLLQIWPLTWGPGTPLFGSIKHPGFSRLSLLFVNKHVHQNNPGVIPSGDPILTGRSIIFHLFKLLSPYDPLFSNPYTCIYDCEILNRFFSSKYFFVINRSPQSGAPFPRDHHSSITL